MKTAAALALAAALLASPALAQTAARLSVETTPISEIVQNPRARAALEQALPQIPQFYDQIGGMTLTQLAPMSQGAVDDAMLSALQAEFDRVSAAPTSGLSVEATPIGELIRNPRARAALEKALPQIPQFYDQIGGMTLTQVAPMSQGAIDDAMLSALQAEFDRIEPRR